MDLSTTPLRRISVLVALTTLLALDLQLVAECHNDRWYATVCSTGRQQRVSVDENGHISLVAGDSIEVQTDTMNYDITDNFTKGFDDGGRWLRRSKHNVNVAYSASSPEGAAALPWMRHMQQQQQQDNERRFYDLESRYNMTILPSSLRNSSDSQLLNFVRPCMCHPNNRFENYYGPNETVPDLYICQVSASFCGIPLPGTGPIVCFEVSMQEVVAVKMWPTILLWYLCLLLICCGTLHGTRTIEFCRSFCNPQRDRWNVDRILAAQNAPFQPPSSWNAWAWQNYRFEQNLLAQTRMILMSEDIARDQLRQEQGLPPPSYEMKTKRYSKHDHCTAEDQGDDDSIEDEEQDCAICFVPLQNGDIVGDLACQHIFHKACLKSWFTRKNACPLCHTILARRRPDPQPHDISSRSHNNNS